MEETGKPPGDTTEGAGRSVNIAARVHAKSDKEKQFGRKSSLSHRRVPGICPDTGEVIKPKGKTAVSGATTAVFVHRIRKAVSQKTKKKVLIRKLKLKKLNRKASRVNTQESSSGNKKKVTGTNEKTKKPKKLAALQKLTPKQKQLRKGEDNANITISVIDNMSPSLSKKERPSTASLTDRSECWSSSRGVETGARLTGQSKSSLLTNNDITSCSNLTKDTESDNASINKKAGWISNGGNGSDDDIQPRSRKSIFAEIFARLQKDLRRVKTDSEIAASYAKDAGEHIDKCQLTPPRRRSSFLRRLSFSSRLSDKQDSVAAEAASG